MIASRCVVLVPTYSAIEPQCDHGLRELEKRGYTVIRSYGNSAIDLARSRLATQAIADGFDELMWIDADIGFSPDDVERLRGHGLPFCCGPYVKKTGKGPAFHFPPGNVVLGKEGGLKEVLYTGLGFVHTRREIYQKMKEACGLPECLDSQGEPTIPFFIPECVHDSPTWRYLSEDYAFCHRVRKCGYKLMADTTIRLSHIGKYPYTLDDLFTASRGD